MVVEPINPLELAEIVVAPVPVLVASPCDPPRLLTVATVGVDDDQATLVVMFAEVPSV